VTGQYDFLLMTNYFAEFMGYQLELTHQQLPCRVDKEWRCELRYPEK
jgi:hypothetical protein